MPVSRDLNTVVVLKKGLTVRGRVVDAAGRPISGATAVLGPEHLGPDRLDATSDERGEFLIEKCIAGPTIITIQAAGFAPLIQDVRTAEQMAPVEIRMAEPGSVLRCRVVDTTASRSLVFALPPMNGTDIDRSSSGPRRTDDGRVAWRRRRKMPSFTTSAGQTTCGSLPPWPASERHTQSSCTRSW